MDVRALILLVVTVLPAVLSNNSLYSTNNGNCPNLKKSLGAIRKRRHLAFPPGSAVSMSGSAVKTFMTHVPSGWFFVIEAEIVYKLPDAEFIAAHRRRQLHHRQKRDIWVLLQSALDQRNINGRSCILRTVCEAQMLLLPSGKSLVHDILRSLFIAPLHEEGFVEEIRSLYDELLQSDYCEKDNDCPISLLNLILDFNKPR